MILQKLNGSTVQISHVQSNEYGVFAYSIVDKQWIRVGKPFSSNAGAESRMH
jgi:hypothetical protein